ncbi:MAG: alpha/beta hydrolase [Acidimicrobiia bacterium]|nr:alpha/beta hydrolase [Acidimicrobiia bacterium]
MDVVRRNNVTEGGNPAGRPMVFAHGYGSDQNMWRYVTPEFEGDYRIVLFDHVGAGGSDLAAYDRAKYSDLEGYAADIVEICEALDLTDVVYVGHSVAAMMGVLAANQSPERFAKLVLVGPSPRYIDDDGYRGGFTVDQIDDLLVSLESNFLGWSAQMAPVIMGNGDRPELGEELTTSFCSTDPEIAAHFAAVTFRSDNREDLKRVKIPTLVLQCSDDVIAPDEVGLFVHDALPDSRFRKLSAVGHCPNLSAPTETAEAIKAFL